MLRLRKWQGAAVVLACCGLLVPNPAAVAAPRTPAKQASAPAPKPTDVALNKTGALDGAVFSPEGKLLDGATVVVSQGAKLVTRTNTNQHGKFAISGIKPGVYQVSVGNRAANVRVWPADAAPPKAHKQAVLVTGKPVVRGQFGGFDTITLVLVGAAVTAAVLAGIDLSKTNELQDDVRDLQDQVNDIASP